MSRRPLAGTGDRLQGGEVPGLIHAVAVFPRKMSQATVGESVGRDVQFALTEDFSTAEMNSWRTSGLQATSSVVVARAPKTSFVALVSLIAKQRGAPFRPVPGSVQWSTLTGGRSLRILGPVVARPTPVPRARSLLPGVAHWWCAPTPHT